jgi:type I restriction enzyme S subunit
VKKRRSKSDAVDKDIPINIAPPFPIPSSWVWTTVGNVGEVRGGIQRSPERRRGRFLTKYIRAANVKAEGLELTDVAEMDISPAEQEVYSLKKGDVLIVEGSGSPKQVGRAAIWEADREGFSFQNHLIRFRSDAVLPGYALTVFKYFAQAGVFVRVARGVGIQHLGISRFSKIPFPLPPLSEQERIVSEVERRMGLAKEAEQSLRSALSRIEQQVSIILETAAFGRLLRPAEPEQDPSPSRSDPDRDRHEPVRSAEAWSSEKLPSDWRWVTVESVGEVKLGRQRSPEHQRGPHIYPYLRVANVFEDRIDSSDVLRMNFSPAEQRIYRLKARDILLNEGQSPLLVGRPAMYRGIPPRVCFQNTLIRFRASKGLDSEFALLVFRHYFRSGKFTAIARWSTNIAHLGLRRFAELPFPLPPEEDQSKTIRETKQRIESSNAQRASAQAALKSMEAMRIELLTSAVSGRLTPQSPEDEPASGLLSRTRIIEKKVFSPTPGGGKELQMNREAVSDFSRRGLRDGIEDLGGRASSEELFEACGYDRDSTEDVEAFYLNLRQSLGKSIRSVVGPNKRLILERVPYARS